MSTKISWTITFIALFGMGLMYWTRDAAIPMGGHDHALKVQWDGFLHYDFFDHPEIRPRFTPIKPADV